MDINTPERQCLIMTVSDEPAVSFELIEMINKLGYVIQKMSLTAIGGGIARLVVDINMPDVLLPGLVMALKHHPQVQEFKHENEFDQLKTMVKAIDEE